MNTIRVCCCILLYTWPLMACTQAVEKKIIYYTGKQHIKEMYFQLEAPPYSRHGSYTLYFLPVVDSHKSLPRNKQSASPAIKLTGQYEMGNMEGEWIAFSMPNVIMSKSYYRAGEKVGIWETVRENGHVVERFDHDLDRRVDPIIHVPIQYPALEREKGIQGLVSIRYQIDRDGRITNIQTENSLSPGCDKETIKSLHLYWSYYLSYGGEIEPGEKQYKVQFSLD